MLAGRKVNDEIKNFIKLEIEKKIIKKDFKKILILGLSYKADVSDLRNSLALQIYLDLKKKYRNNLYAFDPIVDLFNQKKFKLAKKIDDIKSYDLIIPLINHKIFKKKIKSHYRNNKLKYFDLFNFFG